ncbi:flagellin N-terminal helical domain-containing protein [Metabacillus malikii]|uniref:Flagellin n=1 Tax=Metabacillus malikii TaxID=1504265 RepID=A0ABT9ZI33_9BACI|nr:flagellin [Metabacillus malikii]MDQ0231457.1 flagellin [Metabacillus malikii]
MRINHNIAALNTYRQLNTASTAQSKSMEKLSSGLRINKAGDDAAGLAISEKMRGQIRGLDMAAKNSQDGISLIQTAEGALNETHDILQRMRELAVQASNDTNTTSDREEIQKEINQMTSEINRIGNTTEFNTQKLLDGNKASDAKASVTGKDISSSFATDIAATSIELNGQNIALNATNTLDATTAVDINAIVTALQSDINAVYDGTAHNALTFTVKNDGDALVIESDKAGAGSAVQIKANADTAALGLTKDATTDASKSAGSLQFQIGANENQSLTLDIADMRAEALGISTANTSADSKLAVTDGTSSATSEEALSVLTHEDASATVTKIQSAIDKVSAERSKLGANQNRLEHTINNLSTSSENLTAAESRIRDVDYALAA